LKNEQFLSLFCRMWSLLFLASAAQAAEQLMMAAPQQAVAPAAHREEAQAPGADSQQQWAAAEYYYTPEGYLHQRSDPYQGTPVQAGPWVTGRLFHY
jgi:hypothetical protein